MQIIKILLVISAGLAAMIIIDAIWLGVVAKDLYRNNIGSLMATKPNFGAAAIFYIIYASGVYWLVVRPGLIAGSAGKTLINGAVLGLLAYATFDLTSMAVLKDWPLTITLIDLGWGTFITVLVSYVGFLVGRGLGL